MDSLKDGFSGSSIFLCGILLLLSAHQITLIDGNEAVLDRVEIVYSGWNPT